MGDEANRHQVRRSSDRLLGAVDDLKAAERRRRETEMSTPEFHRLAEVVREKADEVWRTAAEEESAGEALSEPQAVTTEEVPPERSNNA
jgi:hypothetical protein